MFGGRSPRFDENKRVTLEKVAQVNQGRARQSAF